MFLCCAVFDSRLSLVATDGLDVRGIVCVVAWMMLLVIALELIIMLIVVNDFDVTITSISFNDTVMVWVGQLLL